MVIVGVAQMLSMRAGGRLPLQHGELLVNMHNRLGKPERETSARSEGT